MTITPFSFLKNEIAASKAFSHVEYEYSSSLLKFSNILYENDFKLSLLDTSLA